MLDFKTVYECNCCLGCKTLHPQVSIINLESPNLEQDAVKFEFYAILLIEECPDSYLLAFHPDLLFRTSLNNHIKNYTFFSYKKEEALHLSQRETAKITCCLENIEDELHHPIDTHSSTILSRHIELLLDYCTRYYERQFITRENKNKTLLDKMEKLLEHHIASGQLQDGIMPDPKILSKELGLSPAYFEDLLKFETGKTLEEYFQLKRLETAKRMLLQKDCMPTIIAKQLGYPSVQYFSLILKKITGFSPSKYRYSHN